MERNERDEYLEKQCIQLENTYKDACKKYDEKVNHFKDIDSSIKKSQAILSKASKGLISEKYSKKVSETKDAFASIKDQMKREQQQEEDRLEELSNELKTKKKQLGRR